MPSVPDKVGANEKAPSVLVMAIPYVCPFCVMVVVANVIAPVCAVPPPNCCRERRPVLFKVVLPPKEMVPPPDKPVPAVMVIDELVRPELFKVPEIVGWKLKDALAPPALVMALATVSPLNVDVVVESVSAPVPEKPGTATERTPVLVMVRFVPPTNEPAVPVKEMPVPDATEEVETAIGTAFAPVAFARTELPAIGAKPIVAFVPPTWYPREPEETVSPLETAREDVATDWYPVAPP
jgi:hypothetical protein